MDDRYSYPPNYPSRNDLITDFGSLAAMDNLDSMSPYVYPSPNQYNPYHYVPPVANPPAVSSLYSPSSTSSNGLGLGGNSGGVNSVGGGGGGGSDINTDPFYSYTGSDDQFSDDRPLLEELGINFDQIIQKTLAVLIPFKKTEQSILHESDLTGPLVFCFAFGMFLLLSGKLHFSYIYGIGIVGCLSVYFLLNLMSPGTTSISFICTVSVLGYSLLPMVVLSGLSVIFNLSTVMIGKFFAITAVLWCALSASKLFVTALALQRQQPLIAYPCALLYGVFALLTVF